MAVPPTVVSEFPSNKPTPILVLSKSGTSSLKDIMVRSSCSEDIKGLSMIVPIEVKGKLASAVIDTEAKVTIVNSQFYDTPNLSLPLDTVLLKEIDPEKSVEGYLVQEVSLTLGGKTYKWDLYVPPIKDQLSLGLDFIVHHKVDPIISKNVPVIDAQYEIPAIIKQNPFKGTTKSETYGVGRVKVNPHGQFPSAEFPHNDYNTVGMSNVCNTGTPDCSFFKGGRRKYKWNFIRPPNPNVQITNKVSLSQTLTCVMGGKEYKWDSSLPSDELDSLSPLPGQEDSNECSDIVAGKGYSWDFYLAPGAEVHSSSCPST